MNRPKPHTTPIWQPCLASGASILRLFCIGILPPLICGSGKLCGDRSGTPAGQVLLISQALLCIKWYVLTIIVIFSSFAKKTTATVPQIHSRYQLRTTAHLLRIHRGTWLYPSILSCTLHAGTKGRPEQTFVKLLRKKISLTQGISPENKSQGNVPHLISLHEHRFITKLT